MSHKAVPKCVGRLVSVMGFGNSTLLELLTARRSNGAKLTKVKPFITSTCGPSVPKLEERLLRRNTQP
eukprot:606531-Amphidinium_carterae.1